VGNRAFGERIHDLAGEPALRAITAILLLAPEVPLLFMGQEWGATQPFCYFTDFHDDLADAVREGRRREFSKFPEFADEAARAHIPDPNAESTFAASRLDWSVPDQPGHAEWLAYTQQLLRLRHEAIVPRLEGASGGSAEAETAGSNLRIAWRLGDGSRLTLLANPTDTEAEAPPLPVGEVLFETAPELSRAARAGRLPPWSVLWLLAEVA
jgi:1,4-alpha-glucan branching enzyme